MCHVFLFRSFPHHLMTFQNIVGNRTLALVRGSNAEDVAKRGDDVCGVDVAEFVGGAFVAFFDAGAR